jgi:hypothetical protein
VQPSDTSREAREIQLALLRAAGPERRAELALNLSSSVIRASRQAIAERNPGLDDLGVQLLWAELHYGRELADRVREFLGIQP